MQKKKLYMHTSFVKNSNEPSCIFIKILMNQANKIVMNQVVTQNYFSEYGKMFIQPCTEEQQRFFENRT